MFLRMVGTDRIQEAEGLFLDQLLASGAWEKLAREPQLPETVVTGGRQGEVAAVGTPEVAANVGLPKFRRGSA